MSFGIHFVVQKPFSLVQCCQKQVGLTVIERYETVVTSDSKRSNFCVSSLFVNTKFLCIVVS